MAINEALVAVNKTLLLVGSAIRGVERTLNNNPPPDRELDLTQLRSDLETVKDQFEARRTALENGGQTIPPPDPALIAQIQPLIAQVEAARNAGAAASATIAVAGQALTLATNVLSQLG